MRGTQHAVSVGGGHLRSSESTIDEEDTMAAVLRFPAHQYEPLVSRKVIAAHFAVSQKTIWRWEAEGLPRAFQRPVRYRIPEVEAWAGRRGRASSSRRSA
jgi:hypothetical protein